MTSHADPALTALLTAAEAALDFRDGVRSRRLRSRLQSAVDRIKHRIALDADLPEMGLQTFKVTVCQECLCAAGGECHTPGCAFWMQDAPIGSDLARLRFWAEVGAL
jgi:hypothetical protein